MKRSSLKQIRTLLALSTVLVLLAMSLTGCFGKGTEDTQPSETSAPQTSLPMDTVEPTEPSEPSQPAPTDPPAVSVMGTVNTDQLNVRTEPDSLSPRIQKLAIGTRLEILETKTVEDETWGRVTDGWVNMKYVTLDGAQTPEPDATVPDTTTPSDDKKDDDKDSTTTNTSSKGTTGTITANSLNIRSGPGTSYKTAGSVKKGDTVTVLEKSGNWGRIDKGWISLKYVKLDGTVAETTNKTDTKTDTTGTVTDVVTDSNKTSLGNVVISTSALNVRSGPGTKYVKVATVTSGQSLAYYQKSGNWVRIDKGWISLSYAKLEGASGTTGTTTGTSTSKVGLVTGSELNIRSTAGTNGTKVGSYKRGDQVAISEVATVGDSTWGKTSKGWISLKYVYIQGEKGANAGTGTVTADSLNIRTGPGTTYSSVGSVKNGETVEILASFTLGDSTWGYTSKGWICMKYITLS